jgi:hypothetical protein
MDAVLKGHRKVNGIDPDYVNAGAAIAGSITGQILSWKATVTIRRGLGLVVASALCGIFTGPGICKLLLVVDPQIQALVNWACGLCGVAIAATIMGFAESGAFRGILARLLGIQGQQPPQQTNGKS